MSGACQNGGVRSVFKILTVKYTEKRPLGRLRPRWESNFKIDLKEIGLRNWTDSAQDKHKDMCRCK